VKTRAPFHRGYDMAEALCASAKRQRKEKGGEGSWLDWHIGVVRPSESVHDLRERQYKRGTRGGFRLTMRPYPLNDLDRGWLWLERQILGPDDAANDSLRGFCDTPNGLTPNAWFASRNRIKQIPALLMESNEALQRQFTAWQTTSPALGFPESLENDGSLGGETPLLDAIELLDLCLRLDHDPRPLDHSIEKENPQQAETEGTVHE
jgi:hypothetical protein